MHLQHNLKEVSPASTKRWILPCNSTLSMARPHLHIRYAGWVPLSVACAFAKAIHFVLSPGSSLDFWRSVSRYRAQRKTFDT
jgi:hypothetical protein